MSPLFLNRYISSTIANKRSIKQQIKYYYLLQNILFKMIPKTIFVLTIFLYECWSQTLVSPCPNLFEYDPQGVVGDRWSGTIKVTLDDELSGIWIRVVFDRPLMELGVNLVYLLK